MVRLGLVPLVLGFREARFRLGWFLGGASASGTVFHGFLSEYLQVCHLVLRRAHMQMSLLMAVFVVQQKVSLC